MNARMEPIREELRTLIANIVRNCQSTVDHNFELMNTSSGNMRAPQQSSTQEMYIAQAAETESYEGANGSGEGTSNPEPDFSVEPSHLGEGFITSAPATSHCRRKQGADLAPASNSGSENPFNTCKCLCHSATGLNSTLHGNPLSGQIYTHILTFCYRRSLCGLYFQPLRVVVFGTQ